MARVRSGWPSHSSYPSLKRKPGPRPTRITELRQQLREAENRARDRDQLLKLAHERLLHPAHQQATRPWNVSRELAWDTRTSRAIGDGYLH